MKIKPLIGKLQFGHVHQWLRCGDMTLQSYCGLNRKRSEVEIKGLMWPVCERCLRHAANNVSPKNSL